MPASCDGRGGTMQTSRLFRARTATEVAAAFAALVAILVAVAPAAAQNASPSATASTAPASSPASAVTPSPTATPKSACNGTLLNGFLIMPNNESPNAFCPDFAPVTAAGPYTVYGLNLSTHEYRLVSADH